MLYLPQTKKSSKRRFTMRSTHVCVCVAGGIACRLLTVLTLLTLRTRMLLLFLSLFCVLFTDFTG
jgi:hypothetical protein